MRVQVLNVSGTGSGLTVSLITPGGGISANWEGDAPLPGHHYDIELDVDALLTWGAGIYEVPEMSHPTALLQCLQGTLERLEGDGVAVVRLEDRLLGCGLILVETSGAAFTR